MAFTINSGVEVFENKQWSVVYQQSNAPKYPEESATLVASTATGDDALYYSGRLLSLITEANATDPSLIGMMINYDPASSNLDQQVPTHVISDQWVNGIEGLDITSTDTATTTDNMVSVSPLNIGTTLYENALISNNPTAVMTGFNSYFDITVINNIEVDGVDCDVISIQGVA